MSNISDPILAEQSSVSSGGVEYNFVNLPKSVIAIVDANINLIWIMANIEKTNRPEEIIENAQSIFTNDAVKTGDDLWKEHCSATIRELLDGQFEANCNRFLKCIPKRNDSDDARQICEDISDFKKFFNDFAHLRKTAIEHAKKLLSNQNLNDIDEKIFDKLCADFVLRLGDYFKFKNK